MEKFTEKSVGRLSILQPCVSAMLGYQGANRERQIFIAFRMDDYSATSNTDLELAILDIFQEKGVGITFGVVPFVCAGNERDASPQDIVPLSREKVDILKAKASSGLLDVALHGCSHQINKSGNISEFAGLDYGDQVQRLAKGKHFLEDLTGAPVESFIPPWNTYDVNTLLALEESGFKTLSAGWKGAVTKTSRLRFIPATCSLENLRSAISAARNSPDTQPIIVVLFHHYDLIESKDRRAKMTLQELSVLLDGLVQQSDLQLMSIGKMNDSVFNLDANRFSTVDCWRSLELFLPSKFREDKPVLIFHDVDILRKTRFKVVIYYGLIFSIFFIAAFLIGSLIFPLSAIFSKSVASISILISLLVNLYTFKTFEPSPKGILASLATIGSSFGMLSVVCLYLI